MCVGPRRREWRCLINKTQFAIFESGRECNLGHIHTKCPNQHPDRYKHVDTSQVMSDDTIVGTAVALIQEHGFQGMIGFHYYNEPCLTARRMFRLIYAIRARESSARFVLWTNGTLFPQYTARQYFAFDAIHVTDYEFDSHPCLADRLYGLKDIVEVHRWPLDDRLTTTGDEPGRPESDAPCCRMFTEMIFDFYGNVHLCCYDWRGLGSPGNIHKQSVDSIVEAWRGIRRTMCMRKMASYVLAVQSTHHGPYIGNSVYPPAVCRTCTAPGRSTHITNFVKAPAEAAMAYREEVLSHGK